MLLVMIALALAGAFLLFAGPFLARLLVRGRDARGLGRVLQALGIALLLAALLLRPGDQGLRDPPVSRTEGVVR
ncbi:MAG TPA: hypothetical protein VFX98_01295 [Longimicrobiaceae bacterium]|nr:hypothetical protein [Longimicrobiaceae bacterium]